MEDNYLTNEEKVDALSMPIKNIIEKLEDRKYLYEQSYMSGIYIDDIKLLFAIIYHLEQAYKNKAEYY